MVLKKEWVSIDGLSKPIEVKELSFMSDFRLGQLREKNKLEGKVDAKDPKVGQLPITELLKESLNEADFALLESLTVAEVTKVLEAITRVNGWDKPTAPTDFQKPAA